MQMFVLWSGLDEMLWLLVAWTSVSVLRSPSRAHIHIYDFFLTETQLSVDDEDEGTEGLMLVRDVRAEVRPRPGRARHICSPQETFSM